jgi:hypothetical protein
MMRRALQIAVALLVLGAYLHACSWSIGYFHQVTAVRGRVVGKDLGLFQFRWLRQSFGVSDATLILREYGYPAKIENLRVTGRVTTDSSGTFDFGSVSKGHYFLEIHFRGDDSVRDLYEIEVTDAVRATKSITIDVSPFHPNCKGGHELLETKT